MGQTCAIEITFVKDEHLRLVLQPAKGGGVDNAVTVALKWRASRAERFGIEPAPAALTVAGIGRQPGNSGLYPARVKQCSTAPAEIRPLLNVTKSHNEDSVTAV